jgi:site-specific DNA-cytosine methylase
MKKSYQYVFGRKRIVVVSLFSGMDLFLFGMTLSGMIPGYAVERNIYAALMHAENFKNPDGSSVIEFLNITKEEYDHRKTFKDSKGRKILEDTCTKTKDGNFIRTKEISEVSGKEISESIFKKFGKDVLVIVIGGPVCHDLTKLNTRRVLGEGSRNQLMKDYVRVIKELNEYGCASICLMEQVTDLGSERFKDVYNDLVQRMLELPFRIAESDICSLHLGGNQNRLRKYFLLTNEDLNVDPIFPEIDVNNVKRVRDFLPDVDYFRAGQFDKSIKNRNEFMCTVTGATPEAFYRNWTESEPTEDELLLCFDVEKGQYIMPEGIPKTQRRKAIGNAVCVSVAKAFAKTIIEKILRVKPDGDGYWISIEQESVTDKKEEIKFEVSDCPATVDQDEMKDHLVSDKSEESLKNAVTDLNVADKFEIQATEIRNCNSTELEPISSSRKLSTHTTDRRDLPSQKIINSQDLAQIQFKNLNFTGEWEQFIGCPSENFHGIIHGKPGDGKSTMAIQWAKYLSQDFGNVIYISGEEGFSQTLQNKFLLTDSVSRNIDIANLNSYNEIIKCVPKQKYQFIFIDSLNTMKITVEELRRLRNLHSESAIITICQSTKGGLLRGSNELIHDCDIHIIVEDGIAKTSKNRFAVTGEYEYPVFKS